MKFPNFTTRGEVFSYLCRHKGELSPEALEQLVAIHDALPDGEEAARVAKRRRAVEADLVEVWRDIEKATANAEERGRRMAQAVARLLGDDSIWKARRVHLLCLGYGLKLVLRTVIDVASRPGFSRAPIDERFRALDRAVARLGDRSKQGRVV